jgi:hypothetical protein
VQHNAINFEKIAGETPHLVELGKGDNTSSLTQKHHKAKKASGKRRNLHLDHKPSDETDLLIQAVNEAALGWKADVCKYQKHHANYGAHCDNEAVSLAQVTDADEQAEEDPAPTKKEFGVDGDADFQKALGKAQSMMKKYGTASEIPDSELPESLDFRDVDGYDFTSYYRN